MMYIWKDMTNDFVNLVMFYVNTWKEGACDKKRCQCWCWSGVNQHELQEVFITSLDIDQTVHAM